MRAIGLRTRWGNHPSVEECFWSRVDRCGPNECWPWLGSKREDGYGRFQIGPKRVRANRYSLELALKRQLGDGLMALHRCDNPPCVNPAHLYEGTFFDNEHDAVARGRAKFPTPPDNSGEHNGCAKLTPALVRQIRARRDAGLRWREIAAEVGMSMSATYEAGIGKRWKSVERPVNDEGECMEDVK